MKPMRTFIIICITSFSITVWSQKSDQQAIEGNKRLEKSKTTERKRFEYKYKYENTIKAKAIAGDAIAMYCYGVFLIDNAINRQDSLSGLEWILRSADKAYAPAYNKVGHLYKQGELLPYDLIKAFEYFNLAAVTDFPPALYTRGYMYYKGLGCNQNYERAFSDFTKGTATGDAGCMYMLGLCYRNGFGTTVDNIKAQSLLDRSVALGFKLAEGEVAYSISENNGEALRLIESGHNAKLFIGADDYIKNSFNRVLDINMEINDQCFKGYVMKYDYSGNHLVGARKVSLCMNVKEHQINGLLTFIDESRTYELTGYIVGNKLELERVSLQRNDRYTMTEQDKLDIDKITLACAYTDENISLLRSKINGFSTYQTEPERPMELILVRDDGHQMFKQPSSSIRSSVYPNPFTSLCKISVQVMEQSDYRIVLTNISGKTVYNSRSEILEPGSYIFPLNVNLNPGTYFVYVYTGKDFHTHKLIKL